MLQYWNTSWQKASDVVELCPAPKNHYCAVSFTRCLSKSTCLYALFSFLADKGNTKLVPILPSRQGEKVSLLTFKNIFPWELNTEIHFTHIHMPTQCLTTLWPSKKNQEKKKYEHMALLENFYWVRILQTLRLEKMKTWYSEKNTKLYLRLGQ